MSTYHRHEVNKWRLALEQKWRREEEQGSGNSTTSDEDSTDLPLDLCFRKLLLAMWDQLLPFPQSQFLHYLDDSIASASTSLKSQRSWNTLDSKRFDDLISSFEDLVKVVSIHQRDDQKNTETQYNVKNFPIIRPNYSHVIKVADPYKVAFPEGDEKISHLRDLILEHEKLLRQLESQPYPKIIQTFASGDYRYKKALTSATSSSAPESPILNAEKAVIIIQKNIRGYLQRRRTKRMALRYMVAREIFETETSYVKTLGELLKCYKIPLMFQENDGLYNNLKHGMSNISDIIFFRIEDLLATHISLARTLAIQLQNWRLEGSQLGKVFTTTKFIDSDLYLSYATNYREALATLNAYKTNSYFKGFLTTAKQNLERNVDLEDLLVAPIQRVPRYLLLLKEMAKKTDKTHADHPFLEEAIKHIHDTVTFINEKKKTFDNLASVPKIQERIYGLPEPLTNSTRLLIFETDCQEQSLSDAGKRKPRHLYLFNDLLLICAPASKSRITLNSSIVFDFKWSISLDKCQLGMVELYDSDEDDLNGDVEDGSSEQPFKSPYKDKTSIAIGVAWKNSKGSLERRVVYSQTTSLLTIMQDTQQTYLRQASSGG